jgi:hypothetical protein
MANQNRPHNPNLSLRQDQIDQIISNQAKSFENQALNIQLQEKRVKANEQIALKSLEFQKEDRKEERKSHSATLNKILIFAAFVLVVAFYGMGWLLSNGHKDLVWDIVKILCGGGLGYGIGASKKGKGKDQNGGISDATIVD